MSSLVSACCLCSFFECKDTKNSKILCLDYMHNIIFNKNKKNTSRHQ